MSTTTSLYIPVRRAYRSRLDEVDWDNLETGMYTTDHMLICDYAEGGWKQPEIVPFGAFSLSPTTLCLHYGQTRSLQGMKACSARLMTAFTFSGRTGIMSAWSAVRKECVCQPRRRMCFMKGCGAWWKSIRSGCRGRQVQRCTCGHS